jgi:hypothetical protein
MMKFCSIALCALIVCLVVACNSNNYQTLPNEFADAPNHFSIRYPKNWKFDSTSFVLREELGAGDDNFQEKIVMGFEKLPTSISANTYAKSVATTYKLLDSAFTPISTDSFSHANFNAQKVVFTTKQNDMLYKSALYILVKDSLAYTLQCNASDTSFASHQAAFDEIIKSANFIK